jgi:geranylgeranylglycerol-phosphate geranylgeranyltransferase
MKIISYLYIFSLLFNNIGNCYQINKLKNNLMLTKINKNNKFLVRLNSNLNSNIKFTNNNKSIKNKLIGYLKLIRYKNIFPTIYLFLTGAWIVNPNINILHNKTLLYSLTSTLCILMSNMVINDLFDIKLDRINNPLRPLITGDVSVIEANILLITLLSITEYINICILSKELQQIIHSSLLYTFIYTPILKKIPLIKNISCAIVVSLSVYVGALSVGIFKNINYLYQTISLVFLGSLYNEILLDIHDYEGDIKHNIYTLATIFGKKIALTFSKFILDINVNLNILLFLMLGYPYYAFLFFLLCIPLFNNLFIMHYNNNYNKKEIIIESVNTSSRQLIFMLLLICLSSIR